MNCKALSTQHIRNTMVSNPHGADILDLGNNILPTELPKQLSWIGPSSSLMAEIPQGLIQVLDPKLISTIFSLGSMPLTPL